MNYYLSIILLVVSAVSLWSAPVRECVGRFEFEAPGELELPGVDRDIFTDEAERLMPYSFTGSTRLSYMNVYVPDRYFVSPELTQAEFEEWTEAKLKKYDRQLESYTASEGYKLEHRYYPEKFQNQSSRLLVMRLQREYCFKRQLYFQKRALRWNGCLSRNTGLDSAQIFDSLLTMFKPRALYNIPREQGVCVPYGFVRDRNEIGYTIGTAYRLKDHPDIEFLFTVGPAAEVPDKSDKDKLWLYWHYPGRPYDKMRVSGVFIFAFYHTVKIAGHKGKSLTATITNLDGTKDYGYAASSMGDYKYGSHKPQILFYLQRTQARALAKGIKPLDEDEVYDLAKRILKSFKWRETE